MADHVHESWWLIESTYAPKPLYFDGHGKQRNGMLTMHMVEDPSRAVRFPDEWSARYTLGVILGVTDASDPMWVWVFQKWGYTVREHIFDYTPRTPGVMEGARDAT